MKKNPILQKVRTFERGFALVVTLSLMILLTLVAVGLLTLSSISLRSSSTSSAIAEARQNARMGLILAIGELQKHAGSDQRITATADLAGDAAGLRLAAGAQPLNDKSVTGTAKGLSSVQPGTRYWTGVFANRDTPVSIFTKTPSPAIVHWLVSGNDTVYPGTGPTLLPSDSTFAVGADGKVGDSTKAVLLVGTNSAGSADRDSYVCAPLVPIINGKSGKPGGRFGWWVGDEGVKARINSPKTLDDGTYASLIAQRRGWESIPGFSSYPTPGTGLQASLGNVTSLPQTSLLIPGLGGGSSSPLQSVFHSATADSRAVLADTLNGGTKVDLTSVLSGSLPTSNPIPSLLNYPVRNSNIIRSGAPRIRAPKWDQLKEFSDRYKNLQGGSLIVTPTTTEFSSAIAPIVTDFRILMGARMKLKNAATNEFNINPCGKVAIAIANPYSVPLKWDKDLEFEILNQTPAGNDPSRIYNLRRNSSDVVGYSTFIPRNQDKSERAVFNNAIFRIRAGTLAPGEARAFTNSGNVFRPFATAAQRVTVDLGPFSSSAPFNFNNCIELDNPTPYPVVTNTPSMDVRETWQTTIVKLEMRLAGDPTTRYLRRIERLELDNGYFSPNSRTFSRTEAAAITQPFPLMLYSFQISQPGADYKSLMPSAYEMGQRASTLRTFADFNLQATRYRKPIASYNPPPYFVESNDSRSQLPAIAPGGETGTGFTRNLAVSPLPWGRSSAGSQKTVLFTIPQQISSIAELQHADLTGDDSANSIAHQPGNAVGNSYATPFVKRRFTSQPRVDYELIGAQNHSGWNPTNTTYYDISYLLNASLWDSYYFSMLNQSGGPDSLAPNLISLDAASRDLKDPVNAAGKLMLDGAFNVNSTDKTAWKAFLASAKHFKHSSDPAGSSEASFPRSLEQISAAANPPTGNDADSFSGFRRLNDSQLDALAEEITKQVRIRGPFLSLSHFVNRAIADIKTQPALTRSGALQAALDESGANINFAGNRKAFTRINSATDAVTLRSFEGAPRADFDGTDRADRPASAGSDPDWGATSTDNNFGAVASIIADREMILDNSIKPEQGYRSTGIPGWLTQADVLQVIGPSLTTRSDTFRIRSFGEALDANGNSVATAYCEAIIQRVPSYVDPSNPPTDRGSALSKTNSIHGRQFQIVSFRWLSPQEI